MVQKIVVYVLLITGLAASSFIIGQKIVIEKNYNKVDIVVDYDELEMLSFISRTDIKDLLSIFKETGVTGVSVSEQTMAEAIKDETVKILDNKRIAVRYSSLNRIVKHINISAFGGKLKVFESKIPDGSEMQYKEVTFGPGLPPRTILEKLPIGTPEKSLQNIISSGLEPIARLSNFPGATQDSITKKIIDLKTYNIKKIIFSGDEILGFKGSIKDTANAIQENNMIFGRIEFSKQKGEYELAKSLPENQIIVHSITQTEMANLDKPRIIDRFTKAVRERNVRLCYIRLFDLNSQNALDENTEYVSSISNSITKSGFVIGDSLLMPELNTDPAVRGLAALGSAAGFIMLLSMLFRMSSLSWFLWTACISVVFAFLGYFNDIGRQLVALVCAISFPLIALLKAGHPLDEEKIDKPILLLLQAIGRTIGAVFTVVVAGLIIASLLSSRAFMMRIEMFAGVKIAHLLPIVFAAFIYASGIGFSAERYGVQKEKIKSNLKRILANPLYIWQAIAGAIILLFIAIMLVRSGNQSGLEVSSFELKFRSVLDKWLIVRPRTKEFLLGYPLLFSGIVFILRDIKRWGYALIVVGTIGLVSSVNTFCHIHTPLWMSALRTFNGMIIGILIGIILYAIIRNLPGEKNN